MRGSRILYIKKGSNMPIIRNASTGGRPQLKPNKLLDYLITKGWGKNDGELARLLEVSPGTVSKIRNGRAASPEIILAIYDATDMQIDEIREMLKNEV